MGDYIRNTCIPLYPHYIYIYIPIDRYLHPHDIFMILRIWWQLSFHSGFIPLYLINFPIDFPIYISIYRWLGISNIYLPNWYPIYIPMYIYILDINIGFPIYIPIYRWYQFYIPILYPIYIPINLILYFIFPWYLHDKPPLCHWIRYVGDLHPDVTEAWWGEIVNLGLYM